MNFKDWKVLIEALHDMPQARERLLNLALDGYENRIEAIAVCAKYGRSELEQALKDGDRAEVARLLRLLEDCQDEVYRLADDGVRLSKLCGYRVNGGYGADGAYIFRRYNYEGVIWIA